MLAGLQCWGIMLGGGTVGWKTWEAIRPGVVVFSYGCVGSDGTHESGHVLHVVLCHVCEEALHVFVFKVGDKGLLSSSNFHPTLSPV